MQALAQDFMGVGVVTQASTTGATAPNAISAADDANPPLERWLWWATTSMRPLTMGSEHPDIMMWGTDVTAVLDDTKGMAKANVLSPATLNVYLTWSPWTTAAWTARGDVAITCWASALLLV